MCSSTSQQYTNNIESFVLEGEFAAMAETVVDFQAALRRMRPYDFERLLGRVDPGNGKPMAANPFSFHQISDMRL
jgi:hypothetical protein